MTCPYCPHCLRLAVEDLQDGTHTQPMPDNRSDSAVRAPIKAVDMSTPEARRQEYAKRARALNLNQVEAFIQASERLYQLSLQEPMPEMECTCPWQWPKRIDDAPTTNDLIIHHESCPMRGMNRLGTKQYFDGKQGNYHGQPRH